MRFKLSIFIVIILSLALVLPACKKAEKTAESIDEGETEVIEQTTAEDLTKLEEEVDALLQPIEKKEQELKKGIDALMAEVSKKKQELIEKEKQLTQRENDIIAQEKELAVKVANFKTWQLISWVALLAGLVLFIFGIIFLVKARKTAGKTIAKDITEEDSMTQK